MVEPSSKHGKKSLARDWYHRSMKTQSSQVFSLRGGKCQCLLDQAATAHTALLLSNIFYVLVLFLLYFYCLLNSFFQLCSVWSTAKGKQFCPEEHSGNIILTRRELVPLQHLMWHPNLGCKSAYEDFNLVTTKNTNSLHRRLRTSKKSLSDTVIAQEFWTGCRILS